MPISILLIQPRSPWGKHPYLPNGLIATAARLSSANLPWKLLDENLGHDLNDAKRDITRADAIGIGCLGPPYVAEVLRTAKRVRSLGFAGTILIGGEFIKRLSREQFDQLFVGLDPVLRVTERELDAFLKTSMPSIYDLSMGPALRALPEEMLKAYTEKEWCLFTSQGCIYQCDFCAASKGMRERFRCPDALADEVETLASAVRRFAGDRPGYEVYLSSLDGFQTPLKMEETLKIFDRSMKGQGVSLRTRFLATAKCTVSSEYRFPGIAKRFKSLGLGCVGIGVDGDDPSSWLGQNKQHNDHDTLAKCFAILDEASIQAEALMVIGFPGDSSAATLRASYASWQYARNGVRPRPYLAKVGVPGSKRWEEDPGFARKMLGSPALFRNFDYSSLGSRVTHPDWWERKVVNAAFLATCLALKLTKVGCPTNPLFPGEQVSPPARLLSRLWNPFMGQDR